MQPGPVLTTEQVRRLDRIAIEEYGVPGVVLMENAGRGAAETALEMLDGGAGPVLVLCGRGNNGGDGFVVARHLHNHRVRVEILLACPLGRVDPAGDAGVNLAIVRRMGLPLREITDPAAARDISLAGYVLLVDALLGTGLSGAVREPARGLIGAVNASGVPCLAIDTPSGLHTDTGEVLGVAVKASRTVTFAAAKRGFFVGRGPEHVGRLEVVDIGSPREILNRVSKG